MRTIPTLIATSLTVALAAADGLGVEEPRVAAQLLFGTAGFEPGLAVEMALGRLDHAIIGRPEVFVNEDGKIGGGLTVGWDIGDRLILDGDDLMVGPRVVYHNGDDHGWELSAAAIYSLPMFNARAPHHVQVIAAGGIMEDKEGDDDSEMRFGVTFGASYAYQF